MIRKRVLDYDDVMNQQREVVYDYRSEVLESESPRDLIEEVIEEAIPVRAQEFLVPFDADGPDYVGLLGWINTTFPLRLTEEKAEFGSRDEEGNKAYVVDCVKRAYSLKVGHEDSEAVHGLERYIILNAIDRLWQEHLYNMDALREGVNLRAHGQRDPLVEYKSDAYKMFEELMEHIKMEVLNNLFRSTTNLQAFEDFLRNLPRQLSSDEDSGSAIGFSGTGEGGEGSPAPVGVGVAAGQAAAAAGGEGDGIGLSLPLRREVPKVGRNEPCPCGSGKKFKQCCGRSA
jgi:preprotein translocase subunit SecA